jgi:hypothetical protein
VTNFVHDSGTTPHYRNAGLDLTEVNVAHTSSECYDEDRSLMIEVSECRIFTSSISGVAK